MDELEELKKQMSILEKKVDKLMKEKGITMEKEKIEYTPIFKDKKALIGNYDFFSLGQTKEILESFGMDVEIVKTSTALLEKIKNGEKYDIIFTNNIYRIGMTGPELLRELKAIPGFNIPVVIHTIDKDKKYYFVDNLGFDDYIAKPILATDKNKVLEIKNILSKLLI